MQNKAIHNLLSVTGLPPELLEAVRAHDDKGRNAKIASIRDDIINHRKRFSPSALNAAKTPRDYIQYVLREKTTTQAMKNGSHGHCLLLEPEKFHKRYGVLLPEETQASGKEHWEAFMRQGKEVLTFHEFKALYNAIKATMRCKKAREVLDDITETEIWLEWSHNGFPLHCRADAKGNKYITEIKFVNDASPAKFEKEIFLRGYHLQMAMQHQAIGQDKECRILAIEVATGNSGVYAIGDKQLKEGIMLTEERLENIYRFAVSNKFHESYNYLTDAISVTKPNWI